MPILISSLPKSQALADAKTAIESHSTAEVVSVHLAEEQGMYSRTFVAALADGSELIVQLKDNEIDLTKVSLALALLGAIVPSMHAAKCEKAHYAYVSSLIPGVIWSVKEDADWNEVLDVDARSRIENLLTKVDELKALPLALCHIDINERNIIVNDGADIVGLIDWEQASLLPFGMNAWCIRYLAVKTHRRVDHISEATLPMAHAFWSSQLHPAVVTAMQVGYILIGVLIEGITPSEMVLSSLVERYDWLEHVFRPLCKV
ncbi:hypothetical protein BDP27DRAFT_1382213 [Rhodocollybia butyracea]|uniref:Aminoglycoside phosphotransferase domain-containing protein n=1 Tax=Rhodocollybia butyracea TaxID=206335 RepID=A0A9P5Q031_9AGAR|nr:hypothetical protein BDP27DRAFT_1382213 [Rhodocollybia butyracea]